MPDYSVILPSKPKVILEKDFTGIYEIDSLYPGYGHTLGNSLRRIILSSLPGAAITSVKISGANHEFSTIEGVKEDAITILLNLKKLRFKVHVDEPQKVTLRKSGVGKVTAGDIKLTANLEIFDPDAPIATITEKGTTLEMELTIEKGLGYVPKEVLHKDKVEIGSIAIDATFTPIRRVNYEVENMRVGDRTDFNRLKILIETDGVITPREALEKSIEIMINQLKAIVGFQEEAISANGARQSASLVAAEAGSEAADPTKVKIEDLELSSRTLNALTKASIRSVGGIARKKEADLLEIEGMGEKGIGEIKRALSQYGLTLKQD